MFFDDEGADLTARCYRETDRAVARFDLDDQRAEHIDTERLAALTIFGVTRHRCGNVIVDPVSVGLIVIIRPAAADDEGTHVPDSRHGHEEGSVVGASDAQPKMRLAGAVQQVLERAGRMGAVTSQ